MATYLIERVSPAYYDKTLHERVTYMYLNGSMWNYNTVDKWYMNLSSDNKKVIIKYYKNFLNGTENANYEYTGRMDIGLLFLNNIYLVYINFMHHRQIYYTYIVLYNFFPSVDGDYNVRGHIRDFLLELYNTPSV
jgi:chitinase